MFGLNVCYVHRLPLIFYCNSFLFCSVITLRCFCFLCCLIVCLMVGVVEVVACLWFVYRFLGLLVLVRGCCLCLRVLGEL